MSESKTARRRLLRRFLPDDDDVDDYALDRVKNRVGEKTDRAAFRSLNAVRLRQTR